MHHPFVYGGKGVIYKNKLNKKFSKEFLNYEGQSILPIRKIS